MVRSATASFPVSVFAVVVASLWVSDIMITQNGMVRSAAVHFFC